MRKPKSRAALQAELEQANDYIEELESKLDDISGIATGEADDDEDESEADEGED